MKQKTNTKNKYSGRKRNENKKIIEAKEKRNLGGSNESRVVVERGLHHGMLA